MSSSNLAAFSTGASDGSGSFESLERFLSSFPLFYKFSKSSSVVNLARMEDGILVLPRPIVGSEPNRAVYGDRFKMRWKRYFFAIVQN